MITKKGLFEMLNLMACSFQQNENFIFQHLPKDVVALSLICLLAGSLFILLSFFLFFENLELEKKYKKLWTERCSWYMYSHQIEEYHKNFSRLKEGSPDPPKRPIPIVPDISILGEEGYIISKTQKGKKTVKTEYMKAKKAVKEIGMFRLFSMGVLLSLLISMFFNSYAKVKMASEKEQDTR